MFVEVRPLPIEKWHGKKGKESFARPKVVEVLYSSETGAYGTNLTPEEEEIYSKKLGVNLSNHFSPTDPHPYWSTKAASIKLENATMIFDTTKAADYVKVKNMKDKSCKFVANSMKEYDEGLWPEATHVIFDEAQEVHGKASKIALKRKAVVFTEKMTTEDKIGVVQILSSKSVRGKSEDFIDVEIDDIIENKTEEFLRVVNMGREEVEIRAQILELLAKGILTKEAGAILYMGDSIGGDYEDAVRWFRNPENAKTRVIILQKLHK